MRRFVHFFVLVIFVVFSTPGNAQQHIDAPRADGAITHLIVYAPKGTSGCAPLALLSHGAGGSEQKNLRYLAEALAHDGWRAIAMGHKESGMAPLRKDMQTAGFKQGISDLVTDTDAYRARFMDIDAALKWSEQSCHAPYKALVGHSMGAITVMFEAGARNKLDVHPKNNPAKGGFDAFVALSPEGPGRVFPAGAWQSIHAPMLIVTGTRDDGLDGDYRWRTQAFDGLGSSCRRLAVLDGATHMNLGGLDPGNRYKSKTATLVTAYLDGVRSGHCPTLTAPAGVTLRSK